MALVGVVTGFDKTNGADRVGALLGGVRHLLVGGVDVARISAINVDAAGVDVVLHRPPSQAGAADQEGCLGSPVVVARAGEICRVPLLVGVAYEVVSTRPFTASMSSFGHAVIVWHEPTRCTIRWPLEFSFTESVQSSGQ